MGQSGSGMQDGELMHKATEISIRLALLAGLALWCVLICRPFVMPVLWGVILAVALNPLFVRLKSLLGERGKLAGAVFVLVGLGALIVPTYLLSESFFDGVRWLTTQSQADSIEVPPPPAAVADWPVIGDRLFAVWSKASDDLEATLMGFGPQLRDFGSWLISTLTGLGFGVLMTMAAVVIAGAMLVNSEGGGRAARTIGARLGGDQGEAAVDLAGRTIRSVASGVVGVAAVQSLLSAVGLFLAGVPAAGLWAVLVLILAVAQLPPLVILGPAAVYVIATSDSTLTMVLFSIWALVVSVSDSFLKPMFLGRGMEIPMPVILIGAIGGMLLSGIIGLFVGAVVLAIGYRLFTAWMQGSGEPAADGDSRG